MDDQPWVGQLDQTFADSTKGADGKLYGGPSGTAFGGGMLYNIPLYKKLGLEIPKTWDEFMANNDEDQGGRQRRPGRADLRRHVDLPVASCSPTTTTSRPRCPTFAADYTANKAKYATTPAALAGLRAHPAESTTPATSTRTSRRPSSTTGSRPSPPARRRTIRRLGAVVPASSSVAPGKANDVGFFALPGDDAEHNGMTVWPGLGLYIPKTVEGDKLEAAKKFIAFAATQPGCDAFMQGSATAGPVPVQGLQAARRCLDGRQGHARPTSTPATASPALEFVSPIKGPHLEQICIRGGHRSGRRRRRAPNSTTQDVKKQAQQLGLPGWE